MAATPGSHVSLGGRIFFLETAKSMKYCRQITTSFPPFVSLPTPPSLHLFVLPPLSLKLTSFACQYVNFLIGKTVMLSRILIPMKAK
jgi:hypothetical protein